LRRSKAGVSEGQAVSEGLGHREWLGCIGSPGREGRATVPRTPSDFGKAFTALLNAASLTVDQVLRKRPGVATRSTLYEWEKGDHLPADTAPLLAVVELCLDLADSDADLRCAPRDTDGWLALLAEAKQSRDSAAGPGPGTGREPGRPGQLIGRWDPVQLGVHKAIGGGTLPPYVHRSHDHLLYALLDPAPAANRLVVLRGGSSTGKSRAAFQAVTARLPHWPVLYPRTTKALARLLEGEQIPGRSVLWLNELRDYAEGPAGQDTLFDLAELLTRRNRIVVLTCVWPDFWRAYTTDHRGGPGTVDPVRATRQLLRPLPDSPELTRGASTPPSAGSSTSPTTSPTRTCTLPGTGTTPR
jgi:hypothetical protein